MQIRKRNFTPPYWLPNMLIFMFAIILLILVSIFLSLYRKCISFSNGDTQVEDYRKNEFFELMKGPNSTGKGISQDDPELLDHIRKSMLIPPSNKPYKLNNYERNSYSQTKQDIIMLEIFNKMRNGFFIECGALNGEQFSNTLLFERDYGWTGLLIEANPLSFVSLKRKQRKAWISHSCLSTSKYPEVMQFFISPEPALNSLISKNVNSPHLPKSFYPINLQCIPIGSYLLALDIHKVDYFSLDVEGADFMILKTIPYENITFLVIEAEINKLSQLERLDLIEFMKTKGYKFYGHWWYDYLFINQSFDTVPFKDLEAKYENRPE